MLANTNRSQKDIFEAQQHIPFMLFRGYHAEYVAEYVGVMVMVYVGCASNAQGLLSLGTWSEGIQGPITWGIGLYFGTLVAMNISGGHLNPAITLVLALLKKFEWTKVLYYMLAQALGAFTGAVLVFLQYYSAIGTYGGSKLLTPPAVGSTAGIFTTFPQRQATISSQNHNNYSSEPTSMECFMDQMVGTLFFAFAYLSLIDPNGPFKKKHLPTGLALAMMAVGCAYGLNSNFAVNPARDFGPRVFCMLAGYGSDVFFAYRGYFIIPVFAPFIGALIGAALYTLLISCHHDSASDNQDKQEIGDQQELQRLDQANE